MRSLRLFVCCTHSLGYWPDSRSPAVERSIAATCLSRRDWAQRALGFAAVAGAALPARADEIDDAFSRILSSAAEEMGQFDAGSELGEGAAPPVRTAAVDDGLLRPGATRVAEQVLHHVDLLRERAECEEGVVQGGGPAGLSPA